MRESPTHWLSAFAVSLNPHHKADHWSLFYCSLIETPQAGLEPATNRLTADRSTTELLRIMKLTFVTIINNTDKTPNLASTLTNFRENHVGTSLHILV